MLLNEKLMGVLENMQKNLQFEPCKKSYAETCNVDVVRSYSCEDRSSVYDCPTAVSG